MSWLQAWENVHQEYSCTFNRRYSFTDNHCTSQSTGVQYIAVQFVVFRVVQSRTVHARVKVYSISLCSLQLYRAKLYSTGYIQVYSIHLYSCTAANYTAVQSRVVHNTAYNCKSQSTGVQYPAMYPPVVDSTDIQNRVQVYHIQLSFLQ